jgi:hypothetical protein
MSPLEKEAARRGVRPPGPATLKKYGLTALEWLAMMERQGWGCPVCLRKGAGMRWNTDHDHVPRWRYMPPEERRQYVRGVLCVYCNYRRVNSHMSAAEAARIAAYLAAYEARRNA